MTSNNYKKLFNIPKFCLSVQQSVIFEYITRSQPCTHAYNITGARRGGGRWGARVGACSIPLENSPNFLFFCYMGGPFSYFFSPYGRPFSLWGGLLLPFSLCGGPFWLAPFSLTNFSAGARVYHTIIDYIIVDTSS